MLECIMKVPSTDFFQQDAITNFHRSHVGITVSMLDLKHIVELFCGK